MSSFFELSNLPALLAEMEPLSNPMKLGLLFGIMMSGVLSFFLAKFLAQWLQRPELRAPGTIAMGLVSITVVVTSVTGQLLVLWPLWVVVGVAIVSYGVAKSLPRSISVRQTGWQVTFAMAVAALTALWIAPPDHQLQADREKLEKELAPLDKEFSKASRDENGKEIDDDQKRELRETPLGKQVTELKGRLVALNREIDKKYQGMATLMILLLTVCVPYLVAKRLGEQLRAPEFVWRVTLILTTVFVALFIVLPKWEGYEGKGWPPKYGVDLQGGANLIYQFDPDLQSDDRSEDDEAKEPQFPSWKWFGTLFGVGSEDTGQQQNVMNSDQLQKALVNQLSRRINPSGANDIVVRPYGTEQIEIIVPNVNDAEIKLIKEKITTAGKLEFRIVANSHKHDYLTRTLVKEKYNRGKTLVRDSGRPVDHQLQGQWVRVARENAAPGSKAKNEIRPFKYNPLGDVIRNLDTHEILTLNDLVLGSDEPEMALAKYLAKRSIRDIEVLVYIGSDDPYVQGRDLGSVSGGFDETLQPMINFTLQRGKPTRDFSRLTRQNKPNEDGETSKLGIILDGELLSAPSIQSQITGRGQITGKFTQEEVDFLVEILRAGSLSAVLRDEPINEHRMGAALGQSTINKGKWAILMSLVCVIVFVSFYYRFSGVVACLALILNLLLVLALMILIDAAFTLPGIAGLILTVGMSVDANVLIFERIREEQARGARLRMAIRNGFARATTTIVDANLTTLITAIVLYAIGTDQIRGFAVTLILGILMSMYTAIFCSRVVFELAERFQNFASLKMFRIVGNTKIDFVGKRVVAGVLSAVLIVAGLFAVVDRGRDVFDIDFLGGTALTLQLKKPITVDDMEAICKKAFESRRIINGEELAQGSSEGAEIIVRINNVEMKGAPEDTVWKLVTSIPKAEDLQELVEKELGERLMTYSVRWQDKQEPPPTAHFRQPTGPFFVSLRPEDAGQNAVDPDSLARSKQDEKGTVAPDAADELLQEFAEKQPAATGSEQPPEVPASTTPEAGSDSALTRPAAETNRTVMELEFGPENLGKDEITSEKIRGSTLQNRIETAAANLTPPLILKENAIVLQPLDMKEQDPKWQKDSDLRYRRWEVTLNQDRQMAEKIYQQLRDELNSTPIFHSANTIGSQVAGDSQSLAIKALLTSLLGIVAYIWIRFQRVVYGLAAVVALVHDVLITLGAIALSFYVAGALNFLQVEEFTISLPIVAAFLTIVGYSLNDTIVVFDRIREVRGKSPDLTSAMINESINQTLSRTILTSLTTFVVVAILYWFGGQGIHGFAFALVVGVVVGTYSSIFVASPVLLWLSRFRS